MRVYRLSFFNNGQRHFHLNRRIVLHKEKSRKLACNKEARNGENFALRAGGRTPSSLTIVIQSADYLKLDHGPTPVLEKRFCDGGHSPRNLSSLVCLAGDGFRLSPFLAIARGAVGKPQPAAPNRCSLSERLRVAAGAFGF
jgi:hypothetical protein